MKSIFARWLLTVLFLSIGGAAFGLPPQGKIVIGLTPEQNVLKQTDRFRPLSEYLSQRTGVTVEFTVLSDYSHLVDAFAQQNVDGAFFGSFTAVAAMQKLGVVPLARPVNLDGESTYHSHIYTRKDSGIKNVADMKGARFAFVDKATTAGYVFPMAHLKEHGVSDIDNYFSSYTFEGRHDLALKAVLHKRAEVGACKNTIFDAEKKKNPRIAEEIVILAQSAKVPSNGLCVRKDLDSAVKDRLQTALLNLHKTPVGQAVLKKLGALSFVETTADDYQPVLDLVEKAGLTL